MKGHILDFSIQQNCGVISGDDQNHYSFVGSEWRSQRLPMRGEYVDFAIDPITGQAVQVYLALHSAKIISNKINYNTNEESYGFFDWAFKCLTFYAEFGGRARRKEFWFFMLFSILVSVLASISDYFLGTEPWVDNISSLILFIPSLAVGARRLHDTGRSGWWQLLYLTIIGIIPLIIWWASDTKTGPNEWGQPAREI